MALKKKIFVNLHSLIWIELNKKESILKKPNLTIWYDVYLSKGLRAVFKKASHSVESPIPPHRMSRIIWIALDDLAFSIFLDSRSAKYDVINKCPTRKE